MSRDMDQDKQDDGRTVMPEIRVMAMTSCQGEHPECFHGPEATLYLRFAHPWLSESEQCQMMTLSLN